MGNHSDRADLGIPFTVMMGWGRNQTLPPPSQACLTSKNTPEKQTYTFLVHTDGAFSKNAVLGHGTAANGQEWQSCRMCP